MNTPTLFTVLIDYDVSHTLGVLKPESARIAIIALTRGYLLENESTACTVEVSMRYTDHEFGGGYTAKSTSWVPIYKLTVSNRIGEWELLDERFAIRGIDLTTPEIL